MPGFYSELQFDPDYTSLPDKIDEVDLIERVQALRAGDYSQVPHISRKFLRLVSSLVTNFAHPARTPDLLGAALLALVESVHRAATNLKDDNIIPYITANVLRRIKDEINNDHSVRIPGRTLRELNAKGIRIGLFEHRQQAADLYEINVVHRGNHSVAIGYHPVEAKPEYAPLEFTEILEKIVTNDIEREVMNLRAESYTYEEIAKQLNMSEGKVYGINDKLKTKFAALYDIEE